jgi:hypothetical protein
MNTLPQCVQVQLIIKALAGINNIQLLIREPEPQLQGV